MMIVKQILQKKKMVQQNYEKIILMVITTLERMEMKTQKKGKKAKHQ